jgi:DNA-binding CsgD family transcriptional regulator
MTVLSRHRADAGTDALKEHEQFASLHELIRRLVGQLVRAADPQIGIAPECPQEEIIIDTSVDGVRYLIVRMPSSTSSLVSLSPREQEIARMVSLGYPNKTIAGVLNISSWTVCTHIRRIFAKLGVGSRAAMVARLSKEGRFGLAQPSAKSAAGLTTTRSISPQPCVAARSDRNVLERV